jgi:putative intracellular protease/amidase
MGPGTASSEEGEVHKRVRQSVVVMMIVAMIALVARTATETSRVVIFLPPSTAMGQEFFPMMDVFEEQDVAVDVVAAELGPYLFWEDSLVGQGAGAVGGYEWDIQMTYDDVDLAIYDVLIIGPGHAHTFWLGDSLPKAEALIQQAYDTGMPLGGVSFGASFLVAHGYLVGRTTAREPFYWGKGYKTPQANEPGFVGAFGSINGTECVWVDRGVGGAPTIVTANYHCSIVFAKRIIEEFLTD